MQLLIAKMIREVYVFYSYPFSSVSDKIRRNSAELKHEAASTGRTRSLILILRRNIKNNLSVLNTDLESQVVSPPSELKIQQYKILNHPII